MLPPRDLETEAMNLDYENQKLRGALQELLSSYKAMMDEKDTTKVMLIHGTRVMEAILNAKALLGG